MFDFGHGNTVNVIHTDVSNVQPGTPDYSCTAFAFATGKWLFDGGTGKYRHAFGFGKFKFFLTVVFQKNHHECDVKAPPKLVIVKVFGFGKATAGNHK